MHTEIMEGTFLSLLGPRYKVEILQAPVLVEPRFGAQISEMKPISKVLTSTIHEVFWCVFSEIFANPY